MSELTHCIAHSPAAPREKQKYLYWPRIAFHTLRCRVTSRSAVGEIADIVKVLTACPLNPPHPATLRHAPRLELWRPACTTASPILYLPKPVACLDRNKPWDQGILYLPVAVLVAQSGHCLPVRLFSPWLSQAAPATTLHPHESCDKRDADAMLPSALRSSSDVDNVDWTKLACQWGLAVLSSWRTGPAQPLCGRLCLSTCGVFRAAAGRHVGTVCPRVPPRPHLPSGFWIRDLYCRLPGCPYLAFRPSHRDYWRAVPWPLAGPDPTRCDASGRFARRATTHVATSPARPARPRPCLAARTWDRASTGRRA